MAYTVYCQTFKHVSETNYVGYIYLRRRGGGRGVCETWGDITYYEAKMLEGHLEWNIIKPNIDQFYKKKTFLRLREEMSKIH